MKEKANETCRVCFHQNETMRRRRLAKHQQRRDHMAAKRDAILSGKLVILTCRDELTGFFYRYDKNTGNLVTLGKGWNYGA